MVSVDVKHHVFFLLTLLLSVGLNWAELRNCCVKAEVGGRPGLPIPNSPYDLCGRKATLNLNLDCAAVEVADDTFFT